MEDSLWHTCPELGWKRISGTEHSDHECTVSSAGSHSQYDKIYAACWLKSFIGASAAQFRKVYRYVRI